MKGYLLWLIVAVFLAVVFLVDPSAAVDLVRVVVEAVSGSDIECNLGGL